MKANHLLAAVSGALAGLLLVGCGASSSASDQQTARPARADVMDLDDSPAKPIASAPRASAPRSSAAPIESPATPVATPPPAASVSRKHVVAAKETLYGIAKQYYGEGKQYTKIIEANPGLTADHLPVGKTIIIP